MFLSLDVTPSLQDENVNTASFPDFEGSIASSPGVSTPWPLSMRVIIGLIIMKKESDSPPDSFTKVRILLEITVSAYRLDH